MWGKRIGWVLLCCWSLDAGIVQDVRTRLAQRDFQGAASLISEYRRQNGVTAELLEALSWMGRGALSAGQYDQAEQYAAETRRLALKLLQGRRLDDDRHLPIALGAAIEVQAQVMAARGERGEALGFLEAELETWRGTSIRTRIQKNIHLLSLEGKPAPPLEVREWLGRKPPEPGEWKGRVVLLFFWAHWCRDCKEQAPVLARLRQQYAGEGLLVIGPTQRYGYVGGGKQAGPQEERAYIERVLAESYAVLEGMPVPLSEENFRVWGASTTPTLVLVDRQGLVRLYHPGQMSYEELKRHIQRWLGAPRAELCSHTNCVG